ncbi:MAG: diaminopimelate epimerase [Pseudomonadales bacterium]
MLLRFTKMHGLGNDFVLLDLISQDINIRQEQIRALADRRKGIGFDQLLIVEPPTDPDLDFRYRIFNADGSEAEQCGNGARCFMRFVRDRGLTTKTNLKLETRNGIIECNLERDGNVSVNMGTPRLAPEHIPFKASQPQIRYPLEFRESLCQPPVSICISVVNIGNPHAVIRVDDVEHAPVAVWGPIIEKHEFFPERTNVGFMEVIDRDRINLRVFERGTGETSACGTGACAAVVAGRLQGLLNESVEVALPGGSLTVSWAGDDAPVILTGPACRVYEGRLHI